MNVEEYLKSENGITLGFVANKMYPNNKSSGTYLTNKLNRNDNRKFTKKDAELAYAVLKKMSIDIINLTIV